MFTYRYYQEDGIRFGIEILQSTKRTCKELIVAPTGAGKSIYVAAIAQALGEPVLILQPSKELLKQNYAKFKKVGGTASICCASLKTKVIKKVPHTLIDGEYIPCEKVSTVTYATPGTARKYINEFKELKVRKAIIDECFPYHTPIVTNKGVMYIGQIHESVSKKEKIIVKSYNQKTKSFEYKKVIKSKYNGEKDTIRIYYSNTSIECTPNHKILTLEGWKKASELVLGDGIISSDSGVSSLAVLNSDQRDLVIGASLGDGWIDYRKNEGYSARIKLIQGEKQKDYLYWKADILNSKDSVQYILENGYSNTPAYSVNTKMFFFKEEFKNYEYQIDNLNYKSLAVLWMDDGSLSKKSNSGTLYALCDKEELVRKLNYKINELGIRGTKVKKTTSPSTRKHLYYISFSKQSVEDLSEKCACYIHSNLSYKIVEKYRNLVGTYIWNSTTENRVKVFKRSEKSNKQKVYDIEVEDNHNFIVTTKKAYRKSRAKTHNYKYVSSGGIVVHNCHLGTQEGSELRNIFKALNIRHVLGLTATPIYLTNGVEGASLKMMNRAKHKMFTDIRFVTQIDELVEENYWSKILYNNFFVSEDSLVDNSNGSDYTVESLKDFYTDNNLENKILKEIDRLKKQGRKSILVFLPSIEEAEDLKKRYPGSEVVHSKMNPKDRDRVVDGFTGMNISVVFNVNVLSVGFDHPQLDAIITARATKSIAIYYQQIGRGVRLFPTKENCIVSDFSGNLTRFGPVEGLKFINVPYYGWGLFNEDNVLLTDYPIQAKARPTIDSLIEIAEKRMRDDEARKNPVFTFGMFRDRKLWDIAQTKDAGRLKSYCSWLYDEYKLGKNRNLFQTPEGQFLLEGIREFLKVK